jgi:hypothetical protein
MDRQPGACADARAAGRWMELAWVHGGRWPQNQARVVYQARVARGGSTHAPQIYSPLL